MNTVNLGRIIPVYVGNWNDTSNYIYYDAVWHLPSGALYICLVANTNTIPSENPTKWSKVLDLSAFLNELSAQELSRQDVEALRVLAEQARVQAEGLRAQAEQVRESSYIDAESARNNSYINSEDERNVSFNQNEQTRQSQENTRQTQEAARQATIAGLNASFAAKIDKTAIKQVLGSSITDLISQKAISELLIVDNFKQRVIADGGKIHSQKLLEETYLAHKDLLPNTKILLLLDVGVKTRVSGANEFIEKCYDLSANNNDAVQSTEANQPYLGNIPVGKYNYLWRDLNTQLNYNSFSYSPNDAFSISLNFKWKANLYLRLGEVTLVFLQQNIQVYNNGEYMLITTSNNFKSGVNYNVNIVYSISGGCIYVNGVPQNTTFTAPIKTYTFNTLHTGIVRNEHNINYFSVFNKALSSTEIANLNTFLTTTFEDIPSAKIGYQSWQLHNFDGVVDGVGNVINEVQGATTDGNSELVINGGFDTADGWNLNTGATINLGVLNINNTGTTSYATQNKTFTTKTYKVTFDVVSIFGEVEVSGTSSSILPAHYFTTTGIKTFYFKGLGGSDAIRFICRTSGHNATIDNVSLKEVGWDSSTLVYDDVYAYTSGTAAQKEQAALKAAAMWCYYNNDINLGAIYGKEYNDYARALLKLNPPIGWRVEEVADYNQLSSYLSAKVGMKLKAKYNIFINNYATNETGFSLLANGYRNELGVVAGNNDYGVLNIGGTIYKFANDSLNVTTIGTDRIIGAGIRLLKTSPNGEVNTPISSGYFTTNIASGVANKDITIPFGYKVTDIIIKSDANLTNVAATLYSTGGVSQAVLITGKSVTANIPNVFNCLVDQPVQYTNPFVRVNATGNVGMGIIINLQKILL